MNLVLIISIYLLYSMNSYLLLIQSLTLLIDG